MSGEVILVVVERRLKVKGVGAEVEDVDVGGLKLEKGKKGASEGWQGEEGR